MPYLQAHTLCKKTWWVFSTNFNNSSMVWEIFIIKKVAICTDPQSSACKFAIELSIIYKLATEQRKKDLKEDSIIHFQVYCICVCFFV